MKPDLLVFLGVIYVFCLDDPSVALRSLDERHKIVGNAISDTDNV